MNYKRLEPHFIKLEVVDSTNNYAANLLKDTKTANGTVVLTKEQTNGKGQRGNTWQSEPDSNLMFSMILYPGISVADVFQLTMMASLAVSRALSHYMKDVSIKWPNDVLVGTKKIAGILIENQFRGESVQSSIIGVGINVNQETFEENLNATSLKLETGDQYNLDLIFKEIYAEFDFYANLLLEKNTEVLTKRYHEKLYGLHVPMQFSDNSGDFSGIIQGVDEAGKLKIDRGNEIKRYDLKEIRFVI